MEFCFREKKQKQNEDTKLEQMGWWRSSESSNSYIMPQTFINDSWPGTGHRNSGIGHLNLGCLTITIQHDWQPTPQTYESHLGSCFCAFNLRLIESEYVWNVGSTQNHRSCQPAKRNCVRSWDCFTSASTSVSCWNPKKGRMSSWLRAIRRGKDTRPNYPLVN